MTDNCVDLANYRLQRAREHLKSAEILLNSGMYSDSLGRSYYAMFAAARALLALKQLDSKKHAGIISLFNQHFVKTGLVERSAGRNLSKARIKRESSDYTDFYLVSKEEAYSQLEAAKQFMATIESTINKLLPETIENRRDENPSESDN
ncbi:HEPN domain-containing protein [Desulfofundulus sp. TPOSR]|uniref:HEPN domain-containing protein n=1 Tax=Desulfofundulus sp. TPOSR TaxID=2714340 RepID=UPI0028BEC9F4|nr:HEPN domain-containing protein [Desulfofundulus sp. TPOSR]